MSFRNLEWVVDGDVGVVTINRPAVLNTLDPDTLGELLALLQRLEAERTPRAVVVTGAGGRAFVAGADIGAMAAMTPLEGRAFSELGHRAMRALEELAQPVVAAVGGYCLGGGLELALACDFIVASETAQFGQPEINLGVLPGFGGTQRLPRRVGVARARELVYLGERIDAPRALAIGLVDRVVPADRLEEEARRLARALAAKPAVALALAKRVVNGALDQALPAGCRLEVEAFATALATEDRAEGMRAFRERRTPAFRGR
jgi:enoyl-CoA hydratase